VEGVELCSSISNTKPASSSSSIGESVFGVSYEDGRDMEEKGRLEVSRHESVRLTKDGRRGEAAEMPKGGSE
jgi:hypothetical protein